jgi:ketosteroid isomerase-like protein
MMPKRVLVSVFTVLALVALIPLVAHAQAPGAAEKELIDLENHWGEVTVKSDVPALERLYSDEYLAIDPAGAIFTKAQDIANVKSGNFKLATFKLDDVKVKIHGEMGVVTGRNTIKATYMGKDISGAYRFTDVFVKRAGRWQVLSTQGTAIAPPTAK